MNRAGKRVERLCSILPCAPYLVRYVPPFVREPELGRCSSDHVSVVGGAEDGRAMKEDDALSSAANSTDRQKAVDSRQLVPASSRKGSELTIEALYSIRTGRPGEGTSREDESGSPPGEGERARLISDITRLIREPHMPETTRCAGLTLIGWLARRMPGEAAHAIGVSEARQSERRLRAAQRKTR